MVISFGTDNIIRFSDGLVRFGEGAGTPQSGRGPITIGTDGIRRFGSDGIVRYS